MNDTLEVNVRQAATLCEVAGFQRGDGTVTDPVTGTTLKVTPGFRHQDLIRLLETLRPEHTSVSRINRALSKFGAMFLRSKEETTRQETLGFSHAAALTGKHVYGGTVSAKEKATRRRRNAAARVARRNNRKGA